jgi:metal-dependent hydrolase (beta-lactamase superfamily II)
MQMTTIGDKTYQVLMDGGPEHLTIERNVKAMAVELKDLDAIVLSHWHSDRAFRLSLTLNVTRHICIVHSGPC